MKAERVELIKAHAPVLEILTKLLEDRLNAALTKQESNQAYGSPAWPYEQADAIGAQRTLKSILSLIDLTKESPND